MSAPPAGKRAGTTVHTTDPLNREPSRAALAEGSVTATDAFYVRLTGALAVFGALLGLAIVVIVLIEP